MSLLPELPAPAATAAFAIRHPTAGATVELPARRTDATLFPDAGFQYWWETGFEIALDTFLDDLREHGPDPKGERRAATLKSVTLMLALALANGLR